jgi:hypothetical protein
LLERLGGRGEEDAGGEGSKEEKEMLAVGEPLLPEESSFWGRESFEQLLEGVAIPAMSAMLPRRLGNFPFWRGGEPFLESLEPFYLQGAGAGLRVFLGEGPPGEEETKVSAKALEPVRKARASRKNLKKKPATRQPLRKARKSKSG